MIVDIKLTIADEHFRDVQYLIAQLVELKTPYTTGRTNCRFRADSQHLWLRDKPHRRRRDDDKPSGGNPNNPSAGDVQTVTSEPSDCTVVADGNGGVRLNL